jgi:hypothetical protein
MEPVEAGEGIVITSEARDLPFDTRQKSRSLAG